MALKTNEELAASLNLRVVKGERWGARVIQDAEGRTLDVVGVDAVPAWLCGYKAALGAAVRAIDIGDRPNSLSGQIVTLLHSMGAPKTCRNPDCRDGFVGGEDPHACGDC